MRHLWLLGLLGVAMLAQSARAQDDPMGGGAAGETGAAEAAPEGPKPLDYDEYTKPELPLPFVDVRGQGEANIILISGARFDERFWTPFMDRNASKYTMHAVVLPGVSGTQSPPLYLHNDPDRFGETPFYNNAMNAIVDYIVQNGLENVYLVGNHIGGKMVFSLIARHPKLFKGGISVNGMPVDIIGRLTINQTKAERLSIVTGQFLPGVARRPAAAWAQRWSMAISNSISDEDRALELSEIMAMQDRDVYSTYELESRVLDDKLALAKNEVPIAFLVNVSEKGMPPSWTLQYWRDRNFAAIDGTQNVDIVYFENTWKYLTEEAPKAFDEAVAAMVAGEKVRGIDRVGPDPDAMENDDPGARERALRGGKREPATGPSPARRR